ncbi:MAG: ABC transporter substrate-binding protein [Geminicoccaceae bacterium]
MSRLLSPAFLLALLQLAPNQLLASTPIIIGLDADMSSVAAQGGEAIRRGALIAIDELNERGGILGRKLTLSVRDHRGNPARGIDNIDDFAKDPNVVAVLGGVHTPVALRELKMIHRHGIPYLDPWAAGTPIIDNGYEPNFAFRLSVRDEYAGAFLVEQALEQGYSRPALLLERTPWGKSNQKAMMAAVAARSISKPLVEWFNWGADDLTAQIESMRRAKADVILLVSNAPEGALLVKTLAALPGNQRLPIIAHWGIIGGDFPALAGPALQDVQLSFLQTFSFFNPPDRERADQVISSYCRLFGICNPAEMNASVGTAHAYDLVHILGRAIELAGTTERSAVRDALESVRDYEGLSRHWDRPFTATRHDALDASSFRLGYFDHAGAIRPVKAIQLPDS